MLLPSDPHHQPPQDHPQIQEPQPPQLSPADADDSAAVAAVADAVPDAAAQPDPDAKDDHAAAPPEMAPRKSLGGKLKKRLSEKQRAAAEQKLSFLGAHLRLVPFRPPPPSERHEAALRALGLYDFARVDFSRELRADLVKPLIAFYDPPNRRSFVRGVRVAVSRSDLARALSLPVKSASKTAEEGAHKLDDEAAAAVMEFMSGYVLLQFEGDDACILPAEVAAAEKLVREGSAHKVDWAGLIWFLVEKEMLEAPKKVDGSCYYAAHLQRLIEFQKPELFKWTEAAREGEKTETALEVPVEVEMEEEEEEEEEGNGEGHGHVRSKSLEEIALGSASVAEAEEQEQEEEKEAVGLSLGIGGAHVRMDEDLDDNAEDANVGEDADVGDVRNDDNEDDDAFEECKNGEGMSWRGIGDDKNDEGMLHSLQRCNSSAFGGMEFENLSKGEDVDMREEDVEMREDVRFDDGLSGKMGSFGRMTSTDLLQAMNTIPVPYNVTEDVHGAPSGEFLAMGAADADKNLCETDLGAGGSFFYGNNGKRHMGDIDEYNGNEQFPQSNHPKRMRSSNDSSVSLGSPEFNATFVAPIQNILAKASMCYAQKEQELEKALMEKQYLNELLQQKDDIIQSVDRDRIDQHRKYQGELGRFQHEFNLMVQLVDGYRKALSKSHASFKEYREKFPCDRPRYVEVAGSGGLVLSVKELERQRLEKEQQTITAVKEMIDKFNSEWVSKLEEYERTVQLLGSRKDALIREVELLKERNRSTKVATPAAEEQVVSVPEVCHDKD